MVLILWLLWLAEFSKLISNPNTTIVHVRLKAFQCTSNKRLYFWVRFNCGSSPIPKQKSYERDYSLEKFDCAFASNLYFVSLHSPIHRQKTCNDSKKSLKFRSEDLGKNICTRDFFLPMRQLVPRIYRDSKCRHDRVKYHDAFLPT